MHAHRVHASAPVAASGQQGAPMHGVPAPGMMPLGQAAVPVQQQPASFEFLPGVASLVEDLDQRVLVTLRDGRHFVGIMRSFDQYGNVMLEDTYERYVHERGLGMSATGRGAGTGQVVPEYLDARQARCGERIRR